MAAFADVARSRLRPFLGAAAGIRVTRGIAERVDRRLQARQRDHDAGQLFPGGDPAVVDGDPLAPLFLGGRSPSPEGYAYFRYRFGTPRYLVALGLLDALAPPDGPVADIGCGGGHLTWALAQRTAGVVVGVDPSFAQLLSARLLAPHVAFVCGDGRALPLASEAFDRVLSSDVLPYVAEKPAAVRELVRLLRPDGLAVLTALRNSRREHVHGGEPLTPDAWLDLAAELPHRLLLADDVVLDRYLAGSAPGGSSSGDAVEASQTVSVVAGRRPVELADDPWTTWPHARGVLGVHPLLELEAVVGDHARHRRRFPSPAYERDNHRIRDYLPETCDVPVGAVPVAGDDAAAAGLAALVASVALLALPDGYHVAPPS